MHKALFLGLLLIAPMTHAQTISDNQDCKQATEIIKKTMPLIAELTPYVTSKDSNYRQYSEWRTVGGFNERFDKMSNKFPSHYPLAHELSREATSSVLTRTYLLANQVGIYLKNKTPANKENISKQWNEIKQTMMVIHQKCPGYLK